MHERVHDDSTPLRRLAVLAVSLLVLGCAGEVESRQGGAEGAAGAARQDEGETADVLARIGEVEVTMADVRDRVGEELDSLELQYRSRRHELLQTAIQDLVSEQLLDDEAARRGVTREELLETELEGRVEVTPQQVEAFYEQNRERLGGRSLEMLRPAIRQFLGEQARDRLIDEMTDGLAEEHGVEVFLEPFRVDLDTEGAPSQGPADAPVTLLEFSDFECPYCGSFFQTLERVQEAYEGRVRVVFRHLPLEELHPNALAAAEASMCAADQDAFWELHDLLFTEQDRLSPSELEAKAERIGLDMDGFRSCMESDRHMERIRADQQAAARLGISGTPAIFVNGRPVEGGAVPFETLAEIIDDELARAR